MTAAMAQLASTPKPPYTAVIFTSIRTDDDAAGYAEMATRMDALATEQPGYLGIESAREEVGITVSYWRSPEDARAWKRVAEHQLAQELGRGRWYRTYRVRVATVERDYGFPDAPAAVGGPNQVASASSRRASVPSPTQAT
jgi:heme-degrading monooxygenase HmoA